ncbi:uncharacterized protein LY89DRAFT_3168 [Mollisia scopiformis]|uniref:Uncharacterized protein n=1 Tax=Mollisia scopiformis TaxID=149040 RepID=A0A194XTZ7_MOLSC|nr:uncharacterized protein LY89DRAFT_3168 [Mollisia scopiformis]KUJ23795.1 hypothetical protein LY89DRAFT_3168 [Mollisia scopiformis]
MLRSLALLYPPSLASLPSRVYPVYPPFWIRGSGPIPVGQLRTVIDDASRCAAFALLACLVFLVLAEGLTFSTVPNVHLHLFLTPLFPAPTSVHSTLHYCNGSAPHTGPALAIDDFSPLPLESTKPHGMAWSPRVTASRAHILANDGIPSLIFFLFPLVHVWLPLL